MAVARGSTTAGRLTRSFPLGHLIPVLVLSALVLGGIAVGIYFGVSSLRSEITTVSPEYTFITPLEISVPEVVQNIPLVETKVEPKTVQLIQESTAEKPVLEPKVSAPDIPLLQVEWKKALQNTIPQRGTGIYSGTVGIFSILVGNSAELVAWSMDNLPDVDPNITTVNGDIVTATGGNDLIVVHRDGETTFAVVNRSTETSVIIIAYLSRDDEKTWSEIAIPKEWYGPYVSEIRVKSSTDGSATLFTLINFYEPIWWMANVN